MHCSGLKQFHLLVVIPAMANMFINSKMKPRNMKQAKHKKIMDVAMKHKRKSNYAHARNAIPIRNSAHGRNKLVKLTSAMRDHNINRKLLSVVPLVSPLRSDTESVTATVDHSQSQVTISVTTTSALEHRNADCISELSVTESTQSDDYGDSVGETGDLICKLGDSPELGDDLGKVNSTNEVQPPTIRPTQRVLLSELNMEANEELLEPMTTEQLRSNRIDSDDKYSVSREPMLNKFAIARKVNKKLTQEEISKKENKQKNIMLTIKNTLKNINNHIIKRMEQILTISKRKSRYKMSKD